MLRTRLHDLLSYYTESKKIKTYEALFDDLVSQQILAILPYETKNFVISKQPKTSLETSTFADHQLQMSRPAAAAATQSQTAQAGGAAGHGTNRKPVPPLLAQGQQFQSSRGGQATTKTPGCFICGDLTHKKIK